MPQGLRLLQLFKAGLLYYGQNLCHQTVRKSPIVFLPAALREEPEQQLIHQQLFLLAVENEINKLGSVRHFKIY